MAELKPTYGNYQLRGQVVWLDRPNAYREGTFDSGYHYRSLEFGIKTADKNIVAVKLFATKFNEVTIQNKATKKYDKKVPYGQHYNLPDGYQLFMPIHMGLEQDANGENIKKQLIPYDAIAYIKKHLKNGDTVFSFGSNKYRSYTDKEGNNKVQQEFEIRGIFKSSTTYEDEEFKGTAVFDQDLILNKSEKKDNKLIVHTYIITDKNGDFVPYHFFIDIDKYKPFALNIKKLKFGTKLKVKGLIHHTVEEQEVQQQQSNEWGEEPEGNKTVSKVFKELEITKAEKPKKEDVGLYTPKDFVKKSKPTDNPFEESDIKDQNEWGNDPIDEDPFAEDDPFADDDSIFD